MGEQQWSRQAPTEPGPYWYWERGEVARLFEVCGVQGRNDMWVASGNYVKEYHGWWLRAERPQPPQEQE